MTALTAEQVQIAGWTEEEYELLSAVSHVIKGDDGKPIGALL